jgi:hypothetical protein
MLKTLSILFLLAAIAFAQDSAKDEAQVWNLEKTPTPSSSSQSALGR